MSKPIAPPPGLKWVIRKTRRTSVAADLALAANLNAMQAALDATHRNREAN